LTGNYLFGIVDDGVWTLVCIFVNTSHYGRIATRPRKLPGHIRSDHPQLDVRFVMNIAFDFYQPLWIEYSLWKTWNL